MRFLCTLVCFCCLATAAETGGVINVSTILSVGEGQIAVSGFTVGADRSLLLIRVVGPSLQKFTERPCLPDPLLVIRRGSAEVYRNDDWQKGPESVSVREMRQVEIRVGAFPLAEDSLDAAVIIGLPKGGYTITIEPSAKNRDMPQTGIVLVEVYVVSL